MDIEQWLGKENRLGIDIWKSKYQYNNETFDEWLDRVSNNDEEVKNLIIDKKFLFGGRILANRGLNRKLNKKLSMSNCFSGDTKFLTKNGVKRFDECVDTVVDVFTSKCKWERAEIMKFGKQQIGILELSKNKSRKTIKVTENHNWIIQDGSSRVIKKTNELRNGDIIPTVSCRCYRAYKPSPFGVAHGFFWGDGDHVDKKYLRTHICKGKEKLLDYYTPDTIGKSGDVFTVSGMPRFFLKKPNLNESSSYLYGWLAGYFAADGSVDTRGACVICSTIKENLELVQDVLCVLGIPFENIRQQVRVSNLTNEEGTVYILSLNRKYLNEDFFILDKHRERFVENPIDESHSGRWKVESYKLTDEYEDVYCANVPSTHDFALENNILTHNCYVLSAPEDNIESIFETCGKLARTYSYGGGCGLDISKLRPANSKVNNAAKSTSGATSFMDLFSKITEVIGQSGRRGALMISISCEHPDVPEFIEIKKDLDKVTKANISIRFTDRFMNAVMNNQEVELTFKSESSAGEEIIRRKINARDLFMKMAESNWQMAEPGALFWDRICNWNLMSNNKEFEYAGTNPCVTKDTLILTEYGYQEIGKLIGNKTKIWNGYEWSEVEPRVTGENQDICLVEFSDGCELKCTPYHKFILKDGRRVEAKELKIGDKLIKCDMPIIQGYEDLEHGYTQGFFSGDGFIRKETDSPYISLYNEKRHIKLDIKNIRSHEETKDTYSVLVDFKDKSFVPDATYSIRSRLQWLAGIIDSDGCSCKDGSIQITSIDKSFLRKIKFMLNTLGVNSIISTMRKAQIKAFTDKKGNKKDYSRKESYRLNIAGSYINKLNSLGFETQRVEHSYIPSRNASRFVRVKNITLNYEKADKVYCFTEHKNHSGIFGGVITAQCAEEPLPAGGSCLLGSINLAEFVNEDGSFKTDDFKKTVRIATKALNDVLDEGLPLHPLQEQRNSVSKLRQIGLGIMGLGDMLIKMKLKYGSEESLEQCRCISRIFVNESAKESAKIAESRGRFDMYDESVLKTPFAIANFDKETIEVIKEHGLRNSQLLTIAPTGTLSTMIGVTGGIEPVFANSYTRTTKSLHGKDVEYEVFTPIVKKYLLKNKLPLEKESLGKLPAYFVTAPEIDYNDRISMQATWQNAIDASISSTVNLPEETTVEEVFDLYLSAWKAGLKGITIYRDNCSRTPILKKKEENESKKSDEKNVSDLKRGEIVHNDNIIGLKRTLTSGCGHLHVSAFFDRKTGDFCELFLGKGSTGGCYSSLNGLARMTSLSARAGVDIEDIIEQLASANACPSYAERRATKNDTSRGSSCPSAIANALREMTVEAKKMCCDVETKNTEHTSEEEKCPRCGEKISHSGGCIECKSCGYSKCG